MIVYKPLALRNHDAVSLSNNHATIVAVKAGIAEDVDRHRSESR